MRSDQKVINGDGRVTFPIERPAQLATGLVDLEPLFKVWIADEMRWRKHRINLVFDGETGNLPEYVL